MMINLKLKTRLALGVGILLVLVLGLGVFSFQRIDSVGGLTEKLYRHPYTVSNAVREIDAEIERMQGLMSDAISSQNNGLSLDSIIQKINEKEKAVLEKFAIVEDRFLGDLSQIAEFKKEFIDWSGKRENVISLIRSGQTGIVDRTAFSDEKDHMISLLQMAQNIKDFASNKGDEFYENSVAEIQQTKAVILIAIGVVAGLSTIIGIVLTSSIGKQLRSAVTVISTSAEQIAVTTAEHERAMEDQATSVNESTTTIEEVTASAKSNSEQAELSASAANSAQEMVSEGISVAVNNRQELSKLEEVLQGIGEQIQSLSEQIGQIGDISSVVSDLAAQTNMLALNAAVEASRAGERGKGFAVVAGEIRKLADQSKKSAASTSEIVSNIQRSTHSMVAAAEESAGYVKSVSDGAQHVSGAFANIKEISEGVHTNAHQVQLNSKQQAAALSQVGIAMTSLTDSAQEIATGTAQIRGGMEKLAEVTNDLNKLI